MKKSIASALLSLSLAGSLSAKAETVVYKGQIGTNPMVLSIETQLPATIQIQNSDPVYDPEYQRVWPGSTNYNINAGIVTLTYLNRTIKVPLYGNGSNSNHGLEFSFDAPTPLSDLQGFTFDGTLLARGLATSSINAQGVQVVDIQFPTQFSARWYIQADYPTDGVRNGVVQLIKAN